MSEIQICAVPNCGRPGYNWGVCSMHRREELAPAVLMEEYENLLTDEDLERQPIKISAVPLRWQPTGGTPYGRAVLASQLERLAATEAGMRNAALFRSAHLLGGYVAGGELELSAAAKGLTLAAEATGLKAREALATIRSGLKGGFRRPITAPVR